MSGERRLECSGIDGTILQRSGVVIEFDKRGKAQADIVQHGLDGFRPAIADVAADAAGHDDVAHQAMAEGGACCAQHALAQHAAMRVHQCEGGIVADGADVAEMVGEPLEFCQQRAQKHGAIRHGKIQSDFGRARKRVGVSYGAVARRAAGELDAARETGAGHQPVDALMDVSKPLFQPDHGLAAGGKAEMSGLDDARMHRADRNLVQAVAFRGEETVGRRLRQCVDAIPQWKAHAPAVVVEPGAGIGRAFGG